MFKGLRKKSSKDLVNTRGDEQTSDSKSNTPIHTPSKSRSFFGRGKSKDNVTSQEKENQNQNRDDDAGTDESKSIDGQSNRDDDDYSQNSKNSHQSMNKNNTQKSPKTKRQGSFNKFFGKSKNKSISGSVTSLPSDLVR